MFWPLALVLLSSLSPTDSADGLKPYRWEKRPLLLFTPSAENPIYREQLARLQKESPAWKEREVVILTCIGPDSHPKLRQAFRIPAQDFTAVFIGKDGDEKWRTQKNFTVADLTQRIDAMPMGREEDQRRRHKSQPTKQSAE